MQADHVAETACLVGDSAPVFRRPRGVGKALGTTVPLPFFWGRARVFREAAAKDLPDYSLDLNLMLPSSVCFWSWEKEASHHTGLACSLPFFSRMLRVQPSPAA